LAAEAETEAEEEEEAALSARLAALALLITASNSASLSLPPLPLLSTLPPPLADGVTVARAGRAARNLAAESRGRSGADTPAHACICNRLGICVVGCQCQGVGEAPKGRAGEAGEEGWAPRGG
jgi:hypothetical protein